MCIQSGEIFFVVAGRSVSLCAFKVCIRPQWKYRSPTSYSSPWPARCPVPSATACVAPSKPISTAVTLLSNKMSAFLSFWPWLNLWVLVRVQLSHSHEFTEPGVSLSSKKKCDIGLYHEPVQPCSRLHKFFQPYLMFIYLSAIDWWHVKLSFWAGFIENYASICPVTHSLSLSLPLSTSLVTSCRLLFREHSKPSCIYLAYGCKYLWFQLNSTFCWTCISL
jgi:hypothetical protein